MRQIYLPILLSFFFISAYAQTFSITGVVKDKKETLPGASIYLANTKIATLTNNDGKFTISNLVPGNYEVLVQMIGYLPYSKTVNISDQSVNIEVLLTENPTTLKEVVIKVDPNREQYLNIFKLHFIGKSANAKDCKILNPDVLRVDYDKLDKRLTVTSTDFLIIENKALGYRLKYLLKTFELDQNTNIVYYEGAPYFEDLKGSKGKKKDWTIARDLAYKGSKTEFFRLLYTNSISGSGYIINKMTEIPNKNRLPDSLINAKIKQETAKNSGLLALTFNKSDSLSFWLRERSKPKTMSVLSRADISVDTLVKTYDKNLKYINFTDKLYVIYTKEQEPDVFMFSGYQVSRPPDLKFHQISMLINFNAPILFYQNGELFNPRNALIQGYWSYEKIASLLPIDYELSGEKISPLLRTQ